MIRVMIVDDHGAVRAGLGDLLGNADDIEVVASAVDGTQAVALAGELDIDVVLMDLNMPGMDGIIATRKIARGKDSPYVVVLTSFSDRERILDAIDAGAVGYLLKDADPEQILDGIRAACRGESPIDPKAAREVLAARAEARPPADLTEREREILALLVSGLANKQIARRLEISEKTVKAHLTAIFRRIRVTDRTQAALWAERHGLL